MTDFVADTHALFWYITGSAKLGPQARQAFLDAEAGRARMHLPAIVLAELFYLNEKRGQPVSFDETLRQLRAIPHFVFHEFTPDHASEFSIDVQVPEMHDRMIVGLTRRLGAGCLTRDHDIIRAGHVAVVW